MTLGCSTTFGWGVADSETYPAQITALSHRSRIRKCRSRERWTTGYTSFQGDWLWDALLDDYKPDVVLWYIVQDTPKSLPILIKVGDFEGQSIFKDNFLYRSKGYLALRYGMGKVQIQAKERRQSRWGGFRVS